MLILTKPLGVSLLMSGYSIGEVNQEDYEKAVESMVRLNKESFDILKIMMFMLLLMSPDLVCLVIYQK